MSADGGKRAKNAVIIIAAAAVVIIGAVIVFHDGFSIKSLFGINESVETDADRSEHFEAMLEAIASADEGGGQSGSQAFSHMVDEEEARVLLEELTPAAKYSITYEVSLGSAGGEAPEYTVKLWRDGNMWRTERSENGVLTMCSICDGENVSVADIRAGTVQKYKNSDSFGAEQSCGLISAAEVREAAFGEANNAEVRIYSDSSETLYEVEYPNRFCEGQTERVYISLEYGVIVSAESLDRRGERVYMLRAVSFYPDLLSDNADRLFVIE